MKKYNFVVVEDTGDRLCNGEVIFRTIGSVHTNSEGYLHRRLRELCMIGYTSSIKRKAIDLDLDDEEFFNDPMEELRPCE